MRFIRIRNTKLICYRNGVILRFHKKLKHWTICGTENKNGYLQIEIDKNTYLCHRIIAHAFKILDLNIPLLIDHRDRNTKNNCIFNLRAVTVQQNGFNRGSKGYTFDKNKWKAQIKINGKSINLGRFEKEEDAKHAYLNAKNIYHKYNKSMAVGALNHS